MKRWPALLVLLLLVPLGCATVDSQVNKLSPEYYSLSPSSILVLPIQNETVDMDAPDVFRPIVQDRVRSHGYQIISPEQVDEELRENGITDPGQVGIYSPQELGELFGADAVLYTVVTEWRTTYLLVYAVIGVGARFQLVDTQSGTVLWEWEKAVYRRMIAVDRETAAETAALALMPYDPLVLELVDYAFSTLPTRRWR